MNNCHLRLEPAEKKAAHRRRGRRIPTRHCAACQPQLMRVMGSHIRRHQTRHLSWRARTLSSTVLPTTRNQYPDPPSRARLCLPLRASSGLMRSGGTEGFRASAPWLVDASAENPKVPALLDRGFLSCQKVLVESGTVELQSDNHTKP